MMNRVIVRIYTLVALCVISAAGQAFGLQLSAPSNLTASAVSSTSIRLNWVDNQRNPAEDGFDVQRWIGSAAPTVIARVGANQTTYTNTGLTSGVTYSYRVYVRKGANTAASNVASATPTGGDTTFPTVPTGLSATVVSCSQINLAWNAASDTGGSGLSGYRLYRNNAYLKFVAAPSTATADTGLAGSTTYSYQVSAVDGANHESARSAAVNRTTSSCSTTASTTSTSTSTTIKLSTTSTSTAITATSSTTTSTVASSGAPALVGYVPGVGTAMGIEVASGLAVVGSMEFGLSAVNVSNPALPVALGGADKPFYGQHVARRGTRAVATGQTATGQARLWVLDVTDSTHPRVQGQLATTITVGPGSGFQRVALTPNGTLAVAAMGGNGLWVVDVSTPTAPVLRGALAISGIAYGVTLNSTGTHAYVAAGTGGLKIVSLSNPAAPALVGSATLTGRNYRDVAVVGTVAYLANQNGTLDVFNVAVPTAPVGLGAATLSGYGLRLAAEGTTVAVITGVSTADSLDVFDVTVPSVPVRRSTKVLGVPGTGQGVALSGGFAYVAGNAEGVQIYDTRMTNPPLSGALEDTFLPRNVAVRGMRAVVLGTYLPTNQVRLKVLDVTVASAPVVRGQLATSVAPVGSTGVALTPNGTLAVMAMGGSGLWVVDVSTPTAPVLRGTLALGGVSWGVTLNSTGTHAYVAAGTAGLKIVSLANPAAPALVGSALPASRNYRDVAVVGTVAYLANQNGTLDVFNVATPSAPVGIGAATLSGYGLRMAAEGTLLTVITGLSTADQLDVFDVTTPAAPVRRSTLVLGVPGAGQGVAQGSGRAFVATGAGGLRIYDLANPSSPALRASGLTVGDANGVAVQSGYAYVADFPATLSIVDW